MAQTVHNPDQYMSDLRQILAQGRKRLGILVGAGGPAGILVDKASGRAKAGGVPLIPVISKLTSEVTTALAGKYSGVLKAIVADLGGKPNIEQILSRVRTLADALGKSEVHGFDGSKYEEMSKDICKEIGKAVSVELPFESTPYSELAGWIGGTVRDHPFEIFTPNYDLLFEQAFERAHIPYFDGFCGSDEPFFDPATIANDELPPRWARVWKLHGSLGWDVNSRNEIIRGKGKSATRLIYPTHLKYDDTQKLPYTALFERLKTFLRMPDCLLITAGFSFSDKHLKSVIDESLAANRGAAVLAFQLDDLDPEGPTCELARRRANMSVYARDAAIINCVRAPWRPGELPHPAWGAIRASYWGTQVGKTDSCFLLGEFAALARYITLTKAEQVEPPATVPTPASRAKV
ncbi:MAG TPA: SIR2 family protein [Verrucomicrobiae bacterium]|nr:SIR2 family protein [Verrucomicrobiae bacterium]